MSLRLDLEVIAAMTPRGARVLDLGCGDGALLARLRDEHACTVCGVEIDVDKLTACLARGVPVLQLDLEQGLRSFADQSFDVVLQLDTLQNLKHTETALKETARVGRIGIVTIPNFAYWRIRASILRGRMPVTPELPYEWFNTPNVRFTTHRDFETLIRRCGLRVLDTFGLCNGQKVRWFPNARATMAVFKISR